MHLKELERDGIIQKIEDENSPTVVRWTLTQKGKDALPTLILLIAFGSKWYAEDIFEDKTPRSLNKIFTKPEAQKIIQRLYEALKRAQPEKWKAVVDSKQQALS